MSEELSVDEKGEGLLDTADVLVRISKKETLAPLVKKFANINVYTKKKGNNGDLEGVVVTETNKESFKDKVEDFEELRFSGSIKVWNKSTLTQTDVDAMAYYGDSLVVTSSKSEEIRKNEQKLDFKNMIVWLTATESLNDEKKSYVKMAHRGIFFDNEKKGKLLFSLTKLLKNPDTLEFSSQITSSEFKGIVDLGIANELDASGFSYFFKSQDLCWARGFWIGGQQARSIYADKSVLHDTKEAIAKMIQKGMLLNDDTLSMLETKLLQTLQSNPFVTRIVNINIPTQKASNKLRGIISGVSIQYESAKEIRTVFIELDSSGD